VVFQAPPFLMQNQARTFLYFMPGKKRNCGFSAGVTWWSGPHKIMRTAFFWKQSMDCMGYMHNLTSLHVGFLLKAMSLGPWLYVMG